MKPSAEFRKNLCDFLMGQRETSFPDIPENINPLSENARIWLKSVCDNTAERTKIIAARGIRLIDKGELTVQNPNKVAGEDRVEKHSDIHPLLSSVALLKGCGPQTAEKFSNAGIYTIYDLLSCHPVEYRDLRKILKIIDIQEGVFCCLCATITKRSMFSGKLFADASDETGVIKLNWFRTWPALAKQVTPGQSLYISGRCTVRGTFKTFSHPDVSIERPHYFFIRYSGETTGNLIKRFIPQALEFTLNHQAETLPDSVIKERSLWPISDSLKYIHNPPEDISSDDIKQLSRGYHNSQKRFAYEELLQIQLTMLSRKKAVTEVEGPVINTGSINGFLNLLPFKLTKGQNKALLEILKDISSGKIMNRLLQGDVGSGKTAVAMGACIVTALSGYQAAFMVPTTILATQQLDSFTRIAEQLNLKCAILTGDTPSPVRKSILAMLEGGAIDILIGTHSLIQQNVLFQDLALAVIDEQHRFGVSQRATLRTKSGFGNCHLLVMTATPIPRSLALTAYGDLEISIIDELPPGRNPVETVVIKTKKEKKQLVNKLSDFLSKGEKIFIVVPLIDTGEEKDRPDIHIIHRFFSENLPEAKSALLHGRMSNHEKNETIQKFRDGLLNMVVATTVIEVGMDIPDASIIVIIESDRFGLAQLHQLRGRVGRKSGSNAFCYLLVSEKPTADGLERLEIMKSCSNGFELSEEDLRMRGAGDILGTKQSGIMALKFGSLIHHREILELAREDAQKILTRDPELQTQPFLRQKTIDFSLRELFGAESG